MMGSPLMFAELAYFEDLGMFRLQMLGSSSFCVQSRLVVWVFRPVPTHSVCQL